ncbi:MAG: hypothetical protein PVG98_07640 [Chromatiales bacterium]
MLVGATPAGAGNRSAATGEPWLDRTHHSLAGSLDAFAQSFDRFFGDPRGDEESRARTFLRLRLEARYREGEGVALRPSAHADVRLPRVSERVRLIVQGRSDEDPDPQSPDQGALIEPRMQDDDRLDAGLRYTLLDHRRTNLSLSGGVRLDAPPKPFVRGRYRYLQPMGESALARLTQNLFWQNEEGFGESTRLDLERRLSSDSLLRWSTSGLFSESSDGWEWRTEGDLFRRLSKRTALNFGISAEGVTRPSAVVDSYRTHVRFRRNFLRDWLFYEIEPELRWPRDEGYDPTPGISLRLEAQLWE